MESIIMHFFILCHCPSARQSPTNSGTSHPELLLFLPAVSVRLQHHPNEDHGPVRAGEAATGRDRKPLQTCHKRQDRHTKVQLQHSRGGGTLCVCIHLCVMHLHFENSTLSPSFLSSVQEPTHQFFFDLSKKQGWAPRGRGRKRHPDGEWRGRDQQHDGDRHHQGPKQPRRHRQSNQSRKKHHLYLFLQQEKLERYGRLRINRTSLRIIMFLHFVLYKSN